MAGSSVLIMRIGKMNKRITIQRLQTTVAGARLQETWTDVATRWAYFDNRQSLRIVIRYLSGIESGMRVLYGNKIFDVEEVKDIEERSKEVHLIVKEVDMHRFDVTVQIYRITEQKGSYNLVSASKQLIATVLGKPLFTDPTRSDTDGKPIEFKVAKKIAVPLDTDIRLGDEIHLGGRQYLVKEVVSCRHWLDVSFEAEVLGHDHH
ncbi:head-tail adaptor protein [Aneurinibacillus thermoaerophilus]|uniref:Head-tail adaptor n=1 Tax=Aneurinibacillus thermoaerophilus TaxID=143495 RepID=A0A1G8ETS5_ANETH|nr:head-tail adaptor protein [Aneurinibacillus thermoaerophilus]MED0757407.1 head-tail adaptor protein [Aneurinibacillus thermoaerophilus]MED0762623.1 head-tail adaptor protein [Aneurinibacillus thermoaerophilus]SDH73119.1 head-tail adaptor [Aneurinibacillus thermoaerophilus]